MLWAMLNGILGFLLFFLSYHFYGKHHGLHPRTWGAQISGFDFAKTVILALTLFACFLLLLFTVYYFFHVDYRFVFFGARVFQPAIFVLLAMYFPFFFVFFLANSLRVNSAMRSEGDSEWKSMLIAGIANSLGLLMILIIQYAVLFWRGSVFWKEGWLYINLLFAVAPIMFVLPFFHHAYSLRLTGRLYLGPLVTCLVFVTILLSNTVCYIPL